ncbi:hypothetical protein NDU88_004970 [Pleurodeles waltl]|uniref:Uncharacterized protein n=1 Tax=Pleurodeles waltl TaxID=8319 RepID=A0AAV7L2E7_PLEWA|nr:hypothetical protein NDU88_004970 [Pleurodeles waltl]
MLPTSIAQGPPPPLRVASAIVLTETKAAQNPWGRVHLRLRPGTAFRLRRHRCCSPTRKQTGKGAAVSGNCARELFSLTRHVTAAFFAAQEQRRLRKLPSRKPYDLHDHRQ